jgi:hypothetical protein
MGDKGDAVGGRKGLAAWGHNRVPAFLAHVNNFVVSSPKLVLNVHIMVVKGQNDKNKGRGRTCEEKKSQIHTCIFRAFGRR